MSSPESISHIRRDLLDRPVREYADNLREQIRDIWRTLGVKDVQGFERLVKERKVREDVVTQVKKLLVEFADVVRSGEAPESEEEREQEYQERVVEFLQNMRPLINDRDLLLSLAGNDTEDAWKLRDSIRAQPNGKFLPQPVLSVAGLDSERAWQIREAVFQQGALVHTGWVWIGGSLTGLDTPRAWEMRKRLLDAATIEKDSVRGWIAEGLGALETEKAWALREEIYQQHGLSVMLMRGLAGLDSEQAWRLRDRLEEYGDELQRKLVSICAVDSPRAWWIRGRALRDEDVIVRVAVIRSLVGLDSDQAWKIREGALSDYRNDLLDAVARSLEGLHSKRAWDLREQLLRDERVNKTQLAFGVGYTQTMAGIRAARMKK